MDDLGRRIFYTVCIGGVLILVIFGAWAIRYDHDRLQECADAGGVLAGSVCVDRAVVVAVHP